MAYAKTSESAELQPLEDEDLQAKVRDAAQDAADFVDSDVAPARIKALKYYRGDPFGDEEPGRSQFVSRDVHDTVKAMLPSLMRTFFGSQRVVEFIPEGPEDVEVAEQATDYVNWIVTRDNPGFIVMHNAVKDALTQRTGVVKYWYEETDTVEEEQYTGLDELTIAVLQEDESLEIDEDSFRVEQSENDQPRYSFTVRRRGKRGRVRIAELPPEEFIIDRRARSVDTATLVGHRSDKTVSDLVDMGYPLELIEEHKGSGSMLSNEERLNRRPNQSDHTPAGDEDTVLYAELWVRLDVDGDGVAELRKFCCIGDGYKVLHHEPAVEAQLADFCPDPEPHSAIGSSVADQTMDIQRAKSQTIRAMQDSLTQSIHPRTGVVEGQANMDDVLNNEMGAVIRMRREGAVQPFTLPYVGHQAFPVLEYFDDVKSDRTGIRDATRGLDSESMQSSTRLAVQSTVEAAQQQLELVARVFLETGLRRLYRGILGLVCRHQDQARMIRLRDEWVTMDPRSWNASMDVEVSTALGTGTTQERLTRLLTIKQTQEAILAQYGPSNPLVTLGQYSHTLSRIAELSGFKDSTQFFGQLPPDWKPPPQEPEQSPEELLAQVQREEILANIEKKGAELDIEREKMIRADDRRRDEIDAQSMLRAAEIEAKYGVDVDYDSIQARLDRDREAGRVEEPPA